VAALVLNALSIWFSYVSVAFVRTATRKTSRMSADVMVRRAEGVRLIVDFALLVWRLNVVFEFDRLIFNLF
jgi:hypothetical protein